MSGTATRPARFTGATARFSPCERYRYTLTRDWVTANHPRRCMFLMLNPSTATAEVLDPTIRRCVGFARGWGFGGLVVCNLFALRSTDPRALYKADFPIGPENNAAIVAQALTASKVIAAWGCHGAHRNRGAEVRNMLVAEGVKLHHLALTADGHPKHPLYLKSDLYPAEWTEGPVS